MTADFFADDQQLYLLPITDAEVYYLHSLRLARRPESLLHELIDSTPWRKEEIVLWGKRHVQPRLIAWYGDDGCGYSYSGVKFAPLPWTPLLSELRILIESLCHTAFNSVLLNYYRDERDSMGMHSDDESELGNFPAIASVSLGAERVLVFKHKKQPDLRARLALANGSLLLMKGATQQNWKHGIDKASRPCGPRINLTFRTIVT
ncbi:MAG: alpha-ketoglutarate-dependent dioxygenase AlkB [Steroidobacteraceae bacterium]